ncbi:MAG: hypothetical protein U0892_23480 [Pirellulales bacterium]
MTPVTDTCVHGRLFHAVAALVRIGLLFSSLAVTIVSPLIAEDSSAATADATQPFRVDVGVGGVWKHGQLTAVRVRCPNSQLAASVHSVLVTTVDGDGVRVTYRSSVKRTAQSDDVRDIWIPVTIGSRDHALEVRLLDSANSTVANRSVPPTGDGGSEILRSGQILVLSIGSSLGLSENSRAANAVGGIVCATISDPADVPSDWHCYGAVDLLLISTHIEQAGLAPQTTSVEATSPLVDVLSGKQWDAIKDWVHQGGSGVISVGEFSSQMKGIDESSHPRSAAMLNEMLPGTMDEVLSQINPAAIEAATSTNQPLGLVTAARLSNVRGEVVLSLIDRNGKAFPWWVRYSKGRGYLTFIGSDLDDPVFRSWSDRNLLWEKLLLSFWKRSDSIDANSEKDVAGSAYWGYDDLIGQLRATLDYFPDVRVISFGQIAAILAGILILVGPVDYWLSVKLLKRPQFSWLFAGIVLSISAGALIWWEQSSRPEHVQVNRASIIDYVPETGTAYVKQWAHVYTKDARRITAELKLPVGSSSARIDWQGLPGKGLGGLDSNLIIDRGLPEYTIQLDSDKAAAHELPLSASGTKGVIASWSETLQAVDVSGLKETPADDQLEGEVINPLTVDLRDAWLIYHKWSYQLPNRIRAGESIPLGHEILPKDLTRRLNRRRQVNSSELITPWDSGDRQSIDRLIELMMFYKAAGGQAYAKLDHRAQPSVDVSNLLGLDQAVLIGRLAEPAGTIAVKTEDSIEVRDSLSTVWCRVFLPVKQNQRRVGK